MSEKKLSELAAEEKEKEELAPSKDEPKEVSEEEEDDEDDREMRGTSCVLQDGSIVEMLYDKQKGKSVLAVYKDGKVSIEEKVRLNDSTLFAPLTARQPVLETGFVQFPSAVGDYESNEILYREVRSFVEKYVQLTPTFLSVVSVYIMMTWLYDRFQNIPYLRVLGMFGTGKSRVLQVAGSVCNKPVFAGGSMSMSAMFRTLNVFHPSLVYDEAEFGEMESAEMRQVLRQGFSAGTPVTRTEKTAKGKLYVDSFEVFGPKILASQSKFRDPALESRCLTEQMFPLAEVERPVQLSESFKKEAIALRNKLIMFRFKNYSMTFPDEATLATIKLPRMKQTGLAITSVAKMLGQEPLNDVIRFLLDVEQVLKVEQADTTEHDVLVCILELLADADVRESGRIRIGKDLAESFNKRHYEEYTDRKSRESNSAYEVMKTPSYQVSPKKIGWIARKMGFRCDHNREGFYIPVESEYYKMQSLARRYGLDAMYKLPDDWSKVVKVVPPEDKIKRLKSKVERLENEVAKEKRKNTPSLDGEDPFESSVDDLSKSKEVEWLKPSDENEKS